MSKNKWIQNVFCLGGSQLVRLSVCLLLTPVLVGKVRGCLCKTLDDVVLSDACPGCSTKGSNKRQEA